MWLKKFDNEFETRLQTMVGHAKGLQEATGKKLLWGTANVFSNKRYMNGAATNPYFPAVAFAGTQIKMPLMLQSLLAEKIMYSGVAAKVI